VSTSQIQSNAVNQPYVIADEAGVTYTNIT
jgi:hypothetical protein